MADLQKKSAQLITEFRKSTVSMAGINYEQTDTMTIRAYGEQTGYSQCISSVGITLAAGTYYLSYKSTNPSSKFMPQLRSSNGTTTYIAADGSFTLGEETTVYPRFVTLGTYTTPVNEWLNIMLNEGSQPLPYEPYSATGWLHSLRKLTTATEAVENPLYSDGTAITAYIIKGNTVQNGTPSPQNPVMPNGVGVRTENLYEGTVTNANLVDGSTSANENWRCTNYMPVDDSSLTVSWQSTSNYFQIKLASYDSTKAFISQENVSQGNLYQKTCTLPNNTAYVRLAYSVIVSGNPVERTNIMVNEGSTSKPYEPYGYKIPIPNGGVTTNIYLGSTQTVRQIKKLTFTGNESLTMIAVSQGNLFRVQIPQQRIQAPFYGYGLCSHYIPVPVADRTTGTISGGNSANVQDRIDIIDDFSSETAFKAYLAAQYANGTPVTVWYVLATAETAAVNEPLMKIGDYADTLSNAVAIPTTEGANSITVDTSVQPSEFTATWTGWHNASVKEYDGSDWN